MTKTGGGECRPGNLEDHLSTRKSTFMSVSYVTTKPMTLDQAIHILKQIGCSADRRDECYAVVKDTNGNYFHLTDDIGSYRTLTIDSSSNQMKVAPTKIQDRRPA